MWTHRENRRREITVGWHLEIEARTTLLPLPLSLFLFPLFSLLCALSFFVSISVSHLLFVSFYVSLHSFLFYVLLPFNVFVYQFCMWFVYLSFLIILVVSMHSKETEEGPKHVDTDNRACLHTYIHRPYSLQGSTQLCAHDLPRKCYLSIFRTIWSK